MRVHVRLLSLLIAAALAGPALAAGPKAPPRTPPKPPVKTAPATPKAPVTPPAEAPPSLTGQWRQLSRDPERFALIDAASVKRTGDKARLVMALAMKVPIHSETIDGAVMLNVMDMDCKAHTARIVRTTAYNDLGIQQYDSGPRDPAAETPPADSNLGMLVAMACGTHALPEGPLWTDPVIARRGWLAAGG